MMWPKGTMPIETMPEDAFIPAISTSPDGAPLTHVFGVGKDPGGYHIIDAAGIRRPVKVTWNGHYATSELAEPFDTGELVAKRPALGAPKLSDEPDELVVELRRIADALETLAKVSKATTPIAIVTPSDADHSSAVISPTQP